MTRSYGMQLSTYARSTLCHADRVILTRLRSVHDIGLGLAGAYIWVPSQTDKTFGRDHTGQTKRTSDLVATALNEKSKVARLILMAHRDMYYMYVSAIITLWDTLHVPIMLLENVMVEAQWISQVPFYPISPPRRYWTWRPYGEDRESMKCWPSGM